MSIQISPWVVELAVVVAIFVVIFISRFLRNKDKDQRVESSATATQSQKSIRPLFYVKKWLALIKWKVVFWIVALLVVIYFLSRKKLSWFDFELVKDSVLNQVGYIPEEQLKSYAVFAVFFFLFLMSATVSLFYDSSTRRHLFKVVVVMTAFFTVFFGIKLGFKLLFA